MAEEDYVERTLTQLPSVFAYRIPPRRSAEGHRAADWTDKVWHGRMRIVQKGREAAIILSDAENNVFAVCPVKEGAVEKVVDSSRFFVLRIENAQGRHAFIGIAFNDRNHAFDFNVALQDYHKDLEREKALAEGEAILDQGPSKDYSLKAGEKISINLKGAGEGSRREKKSSSSSSSGGKILLAPPPRDTPSRRPPRQTTDLVGGGASSAPSGEAGGFSPTAASAPAPATASSSTFDDFGGLGGFGAPASASSSSSGSAFGSGFGSSAPANDSFGMGSLGAALPQQQSTFGAAQADPFGGFTSQGFGATSPTGAAAAPASADPFSLDMFGSAPQPAQSFTRSPADPFDLLS